MQRLKRGSDILEKITIAERELDILNLRLYISPEGLAVFDKLSGSTFVIQDENGNRSNVFPRSFEEEHFVLVE